MPKVNIKALNPTEIHEGATATFTIGASITVSEPLTVYYAMSGTATNGEDYYIVGPEGQATIQAGRNNVAVTLKARHTSETGSETAIMTLQPGPGYRLAKDNQRTLTIDHP